MVAIEGHPSQMTSKARCFGFFFGLACLVGNAAASEITVSDIVAHGRDHCEGVDCSRSANPPNDELDKLAGVASTPHCANPVRGDDDESLFFTIDISRERLAAIARIAPAAASAILNVRAQSIVAPPIDMRGGDVGFELAPTFESVMAKYDFHWAGARDLQRPLPANEVLVVKYLSRRTGEGEIFLRVSSSFTDASGDHIRPAGPDIELTLKPSGKLPKFISGISDRTSDTLTVAEFRSVPASVDAGQPLQY